MQNVQRTIYNESFRNLLQLILLNVCKVFCNHVNLFYKSSAWESDKKKLHTPAIKGRLSEPSKTRFLQPAPQMGMGWAWDHTLSPSVQGGTLHKEAHMILTSLILTWAAPGHTSDKCLTFHGKSDMLENHVRFAFNGIVHCIWGTLTN